MIVQGTATQSAWPRLTNARIRNGPLTADHADRPEQPFGVPEPMITRNAMAAPQADIALMRRPPQLRSVADCRIQ